MKKYILMQTMEEMDYEEAKDWLLENLYFNLDYVENQHEIEKQNELIEILLDSFFIVEEIEYYDYWDNDLNEREREYRKIQGF